jgi:hypothetical protein
MIYIQKFLKGKFESVFIFMFFFLFFIIGLLIHKNFGISNDEPFQRSVGYYWYISIIETFSNDTEYIDYLKQKFNSMYWSDYLNNGNLIQYGILFDTFSAFIEELFNIKNDQDAFYLKHLLTFIIFFLSSIFFYKIIHERFNNKIFAVLITFIFISSPRIFAEAFYNCKDIVFMSFCVISLFFALKNFENLNYKNLFFFSLFAALATNIRVMGIFLFVLFLTFLILDSIEENKFSKKKLYNLLVLLITFPLIVYFFWPFLWDDPVNKLIFTIKSFANYDWPGEVFYLGNFYKGSNLPWHYIPVWIIVTTPILILFLIFGGFYKTGNIFFFNFLNLSEKNKLWINTNQKKDFFILFFLISPIFLVIILDSTLYSGWRHLYFVYPCLIYFSGIGLKMIFKINIFKKNKIIMISTIGILVLNNIMNLAKYHPYQNVFFNILAEKKANTKFEIDYWGLGNKEALKFLFKNKKQSEKIKVRVASFTPLQYTYLILNKSEANSFSIVGTVDQNQEFVFTNYIFDKDPNFEKKYSISSNYDRIFTLKRGNVILNEIFERK